LRFARTCYDHVAGKLGVAIADSMVAKRYLVFSEDRGEMTKAGVRFLTQFGAELDSQAGRWRIFCRAVWIGVSGAIISPDLSARKSCGVVWTLIGWFGDAIRVRSS
jgi:hypothetical protein